MKVWNQIRKLWTYKQWYPVYKEIEMYELTPQEDITAYELTLIIQQQKLFPNVDALRRHWVSVPEKIRRHYTPKIVRIRVDEQYKYPWEKTMENEPDVELVV